MRGFAPKIEVVDAEEIDFEVDQEVDYCVGTISAILDTLREKCTPEHYDWIRRQRLEPMIRGEKTGDEDCRPERHPLRLPK